jgi:hypothetical protein
MCTLQLPERITSSTEGYNALSKLFFDIQELVEHNNKIIIDFSKCKEFDGNLCAAVGAIFDNFLDKSVIMLQPPAEKKIRKVLSRNHFLRAWQVKTEVQEKENYVPYSRFESGDARANEFKEYIDEWLIGKQKFPEHSKAVGENLVASLYEIYANARMHGEATYVYSCGEYKESSTTFEMAIVDLGKTILYNVNEFFKKKNGSPMLACPAICWAFEEGHTTKENTGGLGLSLLREFIELNKGSLHMVSAGGFVEYTNGKFEFHQLDRIFPGTIVNIKFNFSDSKHYWMQSEIPNLNDLL